MKKSTKALIGAAVGSLAVANVVHAALYKPEKIEYGRKQEEAVDVERAAKHLSQAIQCRTVSNPDPAKTDWSAFEEFHTFLDEAYPLIAEKLQKEQVGEASLIYLWKGKDPSLKPIALLSHQDVVPVSSGTENDWEHPAFDGVIEGGYVWGRGALDMKNHLIAVMEAVETLLEEGFEPERDVYLLFGHDEEVVASEHGGAKTIMETLKSRGIELDSVLDEGGAILPVHLKGILDGRLCGIGIAEKGYCDIEISLNHKGGHSSSPPIHSGLGYMADVIKDLESHQFDYHIEPFMADIFEKIARRVSFPARLLTCNISALMPLINQVVKHIPQAASMTHTTTAVTQAKGSPAPNVLPQTPKITVNFRQMPGTTTEDVVKHIKRVVRNKNINVNVIRTKEASKFSPTDTHAFKVIEELCMQEDDQSIVAPYLVMGGTDACFYEPICDNIYRFSPFMVSVDLLMCTHATNERIPVETLGKGVAFFKSYIRRLA